MNSTSAIKPLLIIKNSSAITIQSWFIPFDIFMIMCIILVILLATLFLFTIIQDKTCHTVPMILIANSCLTEFILGSVILSMSVFTLQHDLRQIQYQDSLCVFRGYLGYVLYPSQNYSYLLQAIYRYIHVVYPTHLFWQSARSQVLLISLTWLSCFICPAPFMFTGEITYNVDNQICQVPLGFSFAVIFGTHHAYLVPISMIIFIYLKLVRYVKGISKRVMPVNTLFHAQRDLKMVRQMVILVMGVVTIGFPFALFVVISFFNRTPKYHFRIAFIFVNISIVFVMFTLFRFTNPLKSSIRKKIKRLSDAVVLTGWNK